MKNIKSIFANLAEEDINAVFKKYGIKIPDGFYFSNINIVVGTNGSGKTRFLKALKELYSINKKEKLIYGYFPSLSSEKVNIDYSNDDNLPIATLYEALRYDDYDFEDFLEEIQNQNESFIAQLLTYQSKTQKKRNSKILTSFKDTFKILTGYNIIQEDRSVNLEQNGQIVPLYEILEHFSPGQLMLFYLSIFISLQNNNNRIIILDEPECHLHPSALLNFFALLKESKCFSTMFIATHSLFLVPEFDFEDIVYIDQNEIVPRNSSVYHKLMYNMIGQDYEKQIQFFSNLNQWQFSQYLAECFTNPEVIDEVNANDEQVKLFIEFLKNHKAIRILDFGAGSARLGRSIKTFNHKNKIEYEVYDINVPLNQHGFNYYTNFDELPKGKYDCVVMMNVLHEIEPKEWKNVFDNIYKCMADKSFLLFVETSVLSKGELPNENGFLVLGNSELQKLFKSEAPFPSIKISEYQKSICLVIKKPYLINITTKTVYESIAELEKNAYKKLLEERDKQTYSRKYAFYTQLYINAKIFNERIKSTYQTRANDSSLHTVFNTKEKIDIAKKIIDYLNAVNFQEDSEDYIKELLGELLLGVERQFLLTDGLLNTIWKRVIALEKLNSNKTFIALCLLSLILADYAKAEHRFKNNNYKKDLPANIQNIEI